MGSSLHLLVFNLILFLLDQSATSPAIVCTLLTCPFLITCVVVVLSLCKNSLDSQSAFCTHSAICSLHLYLVYILYPVCSLHFVLTGIRGTNTVYFWLQLLAQHTQSTTKYLCVS